MGWARSELLLGPILRRVEPERIVIWVATGTERAVEAEIFSVASTLKQEWELERVGGGRARSVRIGPGLWVHLAEALPDDGTFPADQLLAYDVALGVEGQARRLGDLGYLSGPGSIAYGDLPLPTFFVRGDATPALRVLHGSCRLLHGKGEDAFPAADEVLAEAADRIEERPSALFLTGDQIYGDDVAGPLIGHLTRLGASLLGSTDDMSVPGVPSLSSIPVYGRQELVEERAGFTSDKAGNHLLSLGEFLAAYLVAWDERNWPATFPAAEEAVPVTATQHRKLRRQYDKELACLEAARRALPAVRRVMANVPVYTAFDDHDVTDDWNLTAEWKRAVEGSPTGRRVVANALAAYWAFQGWGNAPDSFDDTFVDVIAMRDPGETFDRTLWSFDRWSYLAPTDPPTIVLDTRTRRSWDGDRTAARLIGGHELDRVRSLFEQALAGGAGPVVIVSPVPVFGLELQERRQKFLSGKLGPYEIDFEAWHSDLEGLVEFMGLLITDLGLRTCVILSGDVHYGMNVAASFSIDDTSLAVAQLVSSSFKHSGVLAKSVLHLLGRFVHADHERLGWDHEPTLDEPTGLAQRLANRPVNADEWGDGPVFLGMMLASRVSSDDPPRYRETRHYVAPEEHPASVIIGEANVGLVTIDGGRVTHRLLARGGDATETYTATLSLED